jgi:hypothetical protein
MSLQQDSARHDLQIRRGRREELAAPRRHNQLPKLILGVGFADGIEVVRSQAQAAEFSLSREVPWTSNPCWSNVAAKYAPSCPEIPKINAVRGRGVDYRLHFNMRPLSERDSG